MSEAKRPPTKAIHRKRLRDLIGVGKWIMRSKKRMRLFDMMRYEKETECGTSHCFAGWYIIKFPRRDLHFGAIHYPISDSDQRGPNGALSNHFGITVFQVIGLFHAYHLTSPAPLIARIESILKETK